MKDKEKKTIEVVCEEGICPLCGAEIEYGMREDRDNGGIQEWTCPECGATGNEGYDRIFDGNHYDVRTADGVIIDIRTPAPAEQNQTARADATANEKYVVICYAVHDRRIASYDKFDDEDSARCFLREDAENTYEEELNGASDEDKDSVKLDVCSSGTFAKLTSCDGDYIWTWEIITI
jgi:hypothetical protein